MNSDKVLVELENCFTDLLFKESFFAHVGSMLPRVVTQEISTAAVGFQNGKVNLYINPEFFLKTLNSRKERIAVLKHELLHIIFRHLLRSPKEKVDFRIHNYAADLVVNQFVEPWPLPEGAVTLESFSEFRLKRNETLEYYYKKLIDKNEAEALPELEDDLGSHSVHDMWGEGQESNQSGKQKVSKEIEREIANILSQAKTKSKKNWSSLDSNLKRAIDQSITIGQSTKSWKNLLRLFLSARGRSKIRHTMKRVSKRYGTRPGIKVERFRHIVIAVDTSGSIDQVVLGEFFQEIRGIWRTGSTVTVIECDSQIGTVYNFSGKVPESVTGGGGTDFDPVFAWAQKNRNKQIDGIVYLTDGMGPEPSLRPKCPVLWMITGEEENLPSFPFGRIVRL